MDFIQVLQSGFSSDIISEDRDLIWLRQLNNDDDSDGDFNIVTADDCMKLWLCESSEVVVDDDEDDDGTKFVKRQPLFLCKGENCGRPA